MSLIRPTVRALEKSDKVFSEATYRLQTVRNYKPAALSSISGLSASMIY